MKLLPLLLIGLLSACITININRGTPEATDKSKTTAGNADADTNDADCDEYVRTATRLVALTESSSPRTVNQSTRNSAPTTFRMRRAEDQDECLLLGPANPVDFSPASRYREGSQRKRAQLSPN